MVDHSKGHGLIIEEQAETDFVLGGTASLNDTFAGASKVLNPSGDWREFVPPFEHQSAPEIETNGCVSFSSLNVVEMIMRFQHEFIENLSDRFVAKESDTNPLQGNTHRKVADAIKKKWSVLEPEYPFVNSVEEYYQEVPEYLKKTAKKRGEEWEFGYERVPVNLLALRTALTYSPLGISTYAWVEKDGKYFRPEGAYDNHAIVLLHIDEEGNFHILDQYAPFIKIVDKNTLPAIAYRYYLKKAPVKKTNWLIELIRRLFT